MLGLVGLVGLAVGHQRKPVALQSSRQTFCHIHFGEPQGRPAVPQTHLVPVAFYSALPSQQEFLPL